MDAQWSYLVRILLRTEHCALQFRETWEINALSAFNATKAGVKAMMRSGGGSIVLFSSAVAKHGVPNHEAISSAKAAVQGLALATAATYAPKGIRVNCIAPGMVCM
jgi:NAD(P)-dependent dehydrogenase (short-subunit alcohol dehydrogenase family)